MDTYKHSRDPRLDDCEALWKDGEDPHGQSDAAVQLVHNNVVLTKVNRSKSVNKIRAQPATVDRQWRATTSTMPARWSVADVEVY
jgi:hypothetical protein